ncbi:MAG TPA: hypothetical protein VJ761_05310 [Ktedonobacteraceae bacterium]|nr:hypothetical protein [Ktedonobacteraceae bacterium]
MSDDSRRKHAGAYIFERIQEVEAKIEANRLLHQRKTEELRALLKSPDKQAFHDALYETSIDLGILPGDIAHIISRFLEHLETATTDPGRRPPPPPLQHNRITLARDYFEHLLNCLANQKFIHDVNADGLEDGIDEVKKTQAEMQRVIDQAWREGMDLLHDHDQVRVKGHAERQAEELRGYTVAERVQALEHRTDTLWTEIFSASERELDGIRERQTLKGKVDELCDGLPCEHVKAPWHT